jgi:hypothetical protein
MKKYSLMLAFAGILVALYSCGEKTEVDIEEEHQSRPGKHTG